MRLKLSEACIIDGKASLTLEEFIFLLYPGR